MSNWLNDLLDRAEKDGLFDNLSGSGKPLDLKNHNPYEDPSERVAHRLLKQSGYTLPWIEDRRQLLEDIEQVRAELQRAWQWCQTKPTTPVWQRAVTTFKTAVVELNKRIRDFNLTAPTDHVHLKILNAEHEIRRITKP